MIYCNDLFSVELSPESVCANYLVVIFNACMCNPFLLNSSTGTRYVILHKKSLYSNFDPGCQCALYRFKFLYMLIYC